MNAVLWRKLGRDLARRKGSLLALLLIVAIGVGGYGGMASVHRDLDRARGQYYAAQRIADFTVDLKRAPERVAAEVAAMPNVRDARGRIALAARVMLPGGGEPIAGLAISMPDPRRPVINDVLMRSGQWFSRPDAEEVILNEAFARANGLHPGDHLRVLLLDKQYDLLVIGTAMSPEFVYLIPSEGALAPDPARFGVMYLPRRFLRRAGDLDGAWNQIVGQVDDRRLPAVHRTLDQIERRLDPWGVAQTIPYDEQVSIRFLADELSGLRTSALIMPAIFLGVAALVLSVLLGRLATQQRTVIGTLLALGYSRLDVALHYLGFGLAIGLAGAAAGGVAGVWIQHGMESIYRSIYALPAIVPRFYPGLFAQGAVISVGFALLGTLRAARMAARLTPAVAMRPPAPERSAAIILERVPALWRRMGFPARMSLRAVFRNPYRSAVSITANIVAAALIVSALANQDALNELIAHQFRDVAREDIRVALRDPRDAATATAELAGLDGVGLVQPQLDVVCDLTNGPYAKRVGVSGLPPGHTLTVPEDSAGRPVAIPARGLVLSRKLAEILRVRPGEMLRLRPLVGRREVVSAPVTGIADTYLGLSAYANLDYLSRLIGERSAANALLARIDGPRPSPALLRALNRRPDVLGVGERRRSLDQLNATFGETMGAMIGIMVLMAGMIAFGSVLIAALVSLSEREREVGTLWVLGYSPRQILGIFSRESLLLGGLGVALGLWAGVGLAHLMAIAYNTELYRFPVVVRPVRLAESAALMFAFILVAQTLVYRMIRRVPWLDALKVKE